MIKKIFFIFLVIAVFVPLAWLSYYGSTIIANRHDTDPVFYYSTKLKNWQEHLIAHAGGAVDGKIYTNSKEAFNESIKDGFKYLEIDLIPTSDGEYISGHDWERINKMAGKSGDSPMSLAEFKSTKLYGKYTTMDIKDVKDFLSLNPDVILIIDKIRDIDYVVKNLPEDRIILQVYGILGYVKALHAGIKYPVLRLKGGRRGVKWIYKVAMDLVNIKSVILGEKSFNKNNDYIKYLHDKGVSVILYGNPSYQIVDNADEIRKRAGKTVDLVDTDMLTKL